MTKQQIALDYLMVFTFVLFIFILIFASVARQRALVNNQQTFSELQLVAQSVASDITSAAQAGNGYTASIPLPPQLSVLQYNISVSRQGMVMVSTNTIGQYVQATSFALVPSVISNSIYLSPNKLYYYIPTVSSTGYLDLQNSFGNVCVDYLCPSSTNQSDQVYLKDSLTHGVHFNGYGNNGLYPNPVTTSQTESISFWVRQSKLSLQDQYIEDQGYYTDPTSGSCSFYCIDNNYIDIYQYGTVQAGPSLDQECGSNMHILQNQWYFITYTVNSVASSLYIDGQLGLGCSVPLTTGTISPLELSIGMAANENPNTALNGTLTNFQIYSNTLNPSQVWTLYAEGMKGLPIPGANVIAWYPFTQNGNDYSGYSHNLQMNGPQSYPAVVQLQASVYNSSGAALTNKSVGFITDSGTFIAGQAATNNTNSNGIAVVYLNQGNLSGIATVHAVAFNGNSYTQGNLLAWWPAVDNSGLLLHDVSQNSNTQNTLNGNIVDAAWAIPSHVAGFDGQDSGITVQDTAAMQSYPLTITAWVNFNSNPSNGMEFAVIKPGEIYLGACTANLNICYYDPSTGQVTLLNSNVQPGQWNQIAEVVESGQISVFLNGQQIASGLSYTPSGTSGNLDIGYGPVGSNTLFFNGSVANIQLYSQNVYNSAFYQGGLTAVPYVPDSQYLVGWWPLDGNANDYSGNGNNGTIFGRVNMPPISQFQIPKPLYPSLSGLFNGQSAININQFQQPPTQMVSAWVTMNGLSGGGPVFYQSGYELSVVPDDGAYDVEFTEGDRGYSWGACSVSSHQTSNAGLYPNRQYMITGVENITNYQLILLLYINGVLVAQNPTGCAMFPFLLYPIPTPAYIGSYNGKYFTGQISNVQLYNSWYRSGPGGAFVTPATSQQVAKLYSEGPIGMPLYNLSLVGWWPLDGNPNDYTYSDTSVNFPIVYPIANTTGSVNTGVTFVSPGSTPPLLPQSIGGGGLAFNGTYGNVIVTVPSQIRLSAPFTVSAWVNSMPTKGSEVIIGQQNQFRLGINWNGNKEGDFYVNTASGLTQVSTPHSLSYNQWYMLTGVYDGSSLTIYENGVPVKKA